MTPAMFFDVLDAAIRAAEQSPSRPWRRNIALRLTVDEVTIGDRRWKAVRGKAGVRGDAPERAYAYTLRQARQMRQALLPLMRADHERLRKLVEEHLRMINGPQARE